MCKDILMYGFTQRQVFRVNARMLIDNPQFARSNFFNLYLQQSDYSSAIEEDYPSRGIYSVHRQSSTIQIKGGL